MAGTETAGGAHYRVSCIECGSEQVDALGGGMYACRQCGSVRPRALIADPAITSWTAQDGQWWHATAGVFLRDRAGRYLLFRRTRFPVGLTIPAGHIDAGEQPQDATVRELREETGLIVPGVARLGEVDIPGDSCRRGADAHRWYCFTADASDPAEPMLNDEGTEPVWMSYAELHGSAALTYAVRFLAAHYRSALERGTG